MRNAGCGKDCYHATAVDTEAHLARCLTYIDLNMVRCGAEVVAHPREWREAGYGEIQRPPERYRIIDRVALCELLGVAEQRLAVVQNEWIESQLARGTPERDLRWSHAVAVGRRSFVERVREELGPRARYRRIEDADGGSILRDGAGAYRPDFSRELGALSQLAALDSAKA